MKALLISARFTEENAVPSFGSGLVDWVRQFPVVQLLDADSESEKFYLAQLAEAAAQAPAFVLWITSTEANKPIGAFSGLLETWLRHPGPKLLLLQGEHAHLERIGKAHSGAFCKGKNTEELEPTVTRFFRQLTPEV